MNPVPLEFAPLRIRLWQGMRVDQISGQYHSLTRDYDVVLGRWAEQDSIGYGDGMNVYLADGSNPIAYTDPLGLWMGSGGFGPGPGSLAQVAPDGGGATTRPTSAPSTQPACPIPPELAGITDDPGSIPKLSTDTWKIGWIDAPAGVTKLGQSQPQGVGRGLPKTLIARTMLNRTLLKGKPCITAAILAGERKHVDNYEKVAASLGLQLGGPVTQDEYHSLGKALDNVAAWSEMDAATEAIQALRSAKQNKMLGTGCKCTESAADFDNMINGLQTFLDQQKAKVAGKDRPEVLQ